MSYFKAKMRQFNFGCGFALDPAEGAHSALPPDPLAGFQGSYFQEKGGMSRGGDRKEKGKGR